MVEHSGTTCKEVDRQDLAPGPATQRHHGINLLLDSILLTPVHADLPSCTQHTSHAAQMLSTERSTTPMEIFRHEGSGTGRFVSTLIYFSPWHENVEYEQCMF